MLECLDFLMVEYIEYMHLVAQVQAVVLVVQTEGLQQKEQMRVVVGPTKAVVALTVEPVHMPFVLGAELQQPQEPLVVAVPQAVILPVLLALAGTWAGQAQVTLSVAVSSIEEQQLPLAAVASVQMQ